MQADDFFKAYQLLEEHNKNVSLTTMVPSVVNLAFAVELYIKDLHCSLHEKRSHRKDGHNILTLFDTLPESVRLEIFSHDSISKNPFMTRGNPFSPRIFSKDYSPYDRFRDQIKKISNAFVEWRYAHELNTLHYDTSFALALIDALRITADNLHKQPIQKEK